MDEFIKNLTDNEGKNIHWSKVIDDVRKKIPQNNIHLNWFAGKSQGKNILIQFDFLNSQ